MPRTQAADYKVKRKAISQAASRLFAQYGFTQTSVGKIATACKISKSAVFHYHPTKEDILYSVMETHMEQLLLAARHSLYTDFPKAHRFREFSRRLMQCYAGAADSQKILLYELSRLPEKQRNKIVEQQRVLIEFASRLLCETVGPERPDVDHIRSQVMLYFGMINWSNTWFKPGHGLSRDELALLAADTTTGGLLGHRIDRARLYA